MKAVKWAVDGFERKHIFYEGDRFSRVSPLKPEYFFDCVEILESQAAIDFREDYLLSRG